MNILRKQWWKILLVLILLLAITLYRFLHPYQPTDEARAKLESTQEVRVTEESKWISFSSTSGQPDATVIYYPGGLVSPESYALFAHSLAEKNIDTYIVKMPLNLAVLGGQRAEDILPEVRDEPLYIGGHSLGGVMAARYAASNEDLFSGVFFFGSYPDQKGSLVDTDLRSLSITGSQDDVLNLESYQNAEAYWAHDHQHDEIEGANHAQFGSYGEQKGDGVATITPDQQLDEVLRIFLNWVERHDEKAE